MLSFLKLHFPSWVKNKNKNKLRLEQPAAPLSCQSPPTQLCDRIPAPGAHLPLPPPLLHPAPEQQQQQQHPRARGSAARPPAPASRGGPEGAPCAQPSPRRGRAGAAGQRAAGRGEGGGSMPEAVPRSCCIPGAAPAPGWGQRRGLPAALGGVLAVRHLP